MTERKTVFNVTTGKPEEVEYYTHSEFMAKKKARLAELKIQMTQLYLEYEKVKRATGPMLVTKPEKSK